MFLNGAILGMTKQEISEKFDDIVKFAEVSLLILLSNGIQAGCMFVWHLQSQRTWIRKF